MRTTGAKPVREIAIVIDLREHYGRELVAGVLDFAGRRADWNTSAHDLGYPHVWPIKPTPDGIVAMVTEQNRHLYEQSNIPIVNASAQLLESRWPQITSDDRTIGHLAARFFLDRGFRRFLVSGIAAHGYAVERAAGFVQTVRDAGLEAEVSWAGAFVAREELLELIRHIRPPVALFASNDIRAQRILQLFKDEGIRVPEDVAVLGVDDDDIMCRMCPPPLSSIRTHPRRIGFECARVLDRLLRGETIDERRVRVPPLGIVERQSTDVYAVEDRELADMLKWVQEHIAEGINVDSLITRFGQTRRGLEKRFMRNLGRTPLTEIRRARLDLTRKLLVDTNLPMPQVASRAGFADAKTMGMIFRKFEHTTPTAYRRERRILEG